MVGMGFLLAGCAYQGAPFGSNYYGTSGYYGAPGYAFDPGYGEYPSHYQWQRNESWRDRPSEPRHQKSEQPINLTPHSPPVNAASPRTATENRRLLDQMGFKPNN
jgi:hypothetical protein